jgi:hypothetical protein
MKKAQISEFLAIVMMVIVIVLFVIFNKLSSTKSAIDETEKMTTDFENENMWQGANVLMLTKIDGVHMSEMIGIMACHKTDEISFSQNQKINISELIFITLDDYYGKDRWSLEIHESNATSCIGGAGYANQGKCGLPDGVDVKAFNFLFPLTCKVGYGEGIIYVWR